MDDADGRSPGDPGSSFGCMNGNGATAAAAPAAVDDFAAVDAALAAVDDSAAIDAALAASAFALKVVTLLVCSLRPRYL